MDFRFYFARTFFFSISNSSLLSAPAPVVSESLPTRERGLKSVSAGRIGCYRWSLPTRERGLK